VSSTDRMIRVVVPAGVEGPASITITNVLGLTVTDGRDPVRRRSTTAIDERGWEEGGAGRRRPAPRFFAKGADRGAKRLSPPGRTRRTGSGIHGGRRRDRRGTRLDDARRRRRAHARSRPPPESRLRRAATPRRARRGGRGDGRVPRRAHHVDGPA